MHKIINYFIIQYGKLSFKPFMKLLNRLFTLYISIKRRVLRNRIVISNIDGINYELNLNEMIDSAIFFSGCFDRNTTNAINRLCKEEMIVLDIGANVGAYTLRIAKIIGKMGRVIAFEPMAWAFLKLKRNMELNNFQNITLEKLALTNETKNEINGFKSSWLLSGGSCDISQKKELIQFMKLDNYLSKKGIKEVDFIKLDVDGYEFKVLQGAINTLKKDKPIIILELGIYTLDRVDDKIEDMISFLSYLGYKFYSESDFKEFSNTKAMINSIGESSTINVIVSVNPL